LGESGKVKSAFMTINKTFFITGTDTGVGKTVATLVLGSLFQKRGLDVGVFKPVQSGRLGGGDAEFLPPSRYPRTWPLPGRGPGSNG
jgi:uncharacterized NAD-dependent epimerase/dehydratase family protein